jgi:hypothetical protein
LAEPDVDVVKAHCQGSVPPFAPPLSRHEERVWLMLGVAQALMATLIGFFALLTGKPALGLGAIGIAGLTIAAALWKVRQLSRRRERAEAILPRH